MPQATSSREAHGMHVTVYITLIPHHPYLPLISLALLATMSSASNGNPGEETSLETSTSQAPPQAWLTSIANSIVLLNTAVTHFFHSFSLTDAFLTPTLSETRLPEVMRTYITDSVKLALFKSTLVAANCILSKSWSLSLASSQFLPAGLLSAVALWFCRRSLLWILRRALL